MKTAICVIIKDEQNYLDEWLDYHLNLGIDEIYLYEDYGSLSHSTITEKYGDRVYLNSINVIFQNNFNWFRSYNPKGSLIQEKLFDWFPITYKEQIDWVLFIDIDEFLILKQPLHNLLNEFKDKTGLYLQWKYYGASGHIKKPKGKVMDMFTTSNANSLDFHYTYKSFVNCKKFNGWIKPIHGVKDGVFPLSETGEHQAYVNHYFTKSWEEWKDKLFNRGDVCPGNRKITQFFKINQDMLPLKHELLLNIAIDEATKLGFNQNKNKGNKYIHIVWFGGNPYNEIHLKCIESWKKFLSNDFIVCLWNEFSFGFNDHHFTKSAYKSQSWAFVADYVRLYVVYYYGGIYLDMDVELLKPIDNLPTNFMCIEKDYDAIAFGLGFGAEKENNIIGGILKQYDDIEFKKENMFDITIPTLTMKYLTSIGYVFQNKTVHSFMDFTIYPDFYFCPKSNVKQTFDIKNETIAIHHYIGSWACE